MTLQEFFVKIGGNYNDAASRLMTEARMLKYIKMFLNMEDYPKMIAAVDEHRAEDAFRASHSVKGMCLNLSLGDLARSSSELCELYRGAATAPDDAIVAPVLARVKADYQNIVDASAELFADGQ